MVVCLIGSTGLIGNLVLHELIEETAVAKIISIGRRPLGIQSPKIQEIQSTLENLPQLPSQQADHWICTLGSTIKKAGSQEAFKAVDLEGVVQFAKLAERSNAKSLHIVSALGADTQSKVFYNQVKGAMQTQVSTKKIPSIYFYQPSLLVGERQESRPLEALSLKLAPAISSLLVGPLKTYRPIPAGLVAKSIVNHLKHPRSGIHVISNLEMLGS